MNLRILLLLLPILAACTDRPSRPAPGHLLPSKDEIWTSGGQSFSASELEALAEHFPPLSRESLVTLSQWLSLLPELLEAGKIRDGLSPVEFAQDLRNLLPPEPTGFDAKAFTKRLHEVYQSESVSTWRSELDGRVREKHFEWNASLLKDYGISPR